MIILFFLCSDQQKEDDDVQLQNNSTQNTTNQKRPDYPKKPPTSYNFFVKAKHDKIVRNNPGMNSVISAFIF